MVGRKEGGEGREWREGRDGKRDPFFFFFCLFLGEEGFLCSRGKWYATCTCMYECMCCVWSM